MGKVKAKITGVDDVSAGLKRFLTQAIKDETTLKAVATDLVDQIQKRTQAKQEDYKQPKLKKSTIERRKTLIKQGNSSAFADASRSNLTLSGQLLSSLRFAVESASSLIKISLSDFRRPYKGKSGQDLEKNTNSEIKTELESRGFKFLFISEKLTARLQSKLKAEIRRQLQNYRAIKRSLK